MAGVCSSLADIKSFLNKSAPYSWRIFRALAQGVTEKSTSDFVTLNSLASILNNRNQQINSYQVSKSEGEMYLYDINRKQTIITIFLYSSKLNKSAIEVLHRLGMCSSYTHLNDVLKRLAKMLEAQLKEDTAEKGMKVTLDNFNKMIGVRDGSSIRHSYQNNSTGGYASAVRGLPSNLKAIPRDWYIPGARMMLTPRQLKPSDAAFTYMNDFTLFYIGKLLIDHVGSGWKVAGDGVEAEDHLSVFKRPEVECLELVPTAIYPLELMDIEQQSVDGNLRGVFKVLTEALGCSPEQLMEGLFLVGGDQLLLDRLRSIQLLREGDVPGEDFMFVVTLLGPLHTCMNKKKLIMRHHFGGMDEAGSLMSFNKVLKRDRKIDKEAKDLWACMDLTRDSLDGVLLGLLMEESGKSYATFASFCADVKSGELNWKNLVLQVSKKFKYRYVWNERNKGISPVFLEAE